jgi:hypothetical protein
MAPFFLKKVRLSTSLAGDVTLVCTEQIEPGNACTLLLEQAYSHIKCTSDSVAGQQLAQLHKVGLSSTRLHVAWRTYAGASAQGHRHGTVQSQTKLA